MILMLLFIIYGIIYGIVHKDTYEFFKMSEFTFNKNVHEPNKLLLCESEVKCIQYKENGLTIIKEDKPYIFIHIPKNAGTYVRKVLPGINGGHDHVSLNDIKKNFPKLYNECYSFAILRNPWERCVSMYNFHINTDSMDIKGWGNYGMNILKKHNVNSFEDFIQLLYNHKDNIRILGEIVWEKQTYFITDDRGVLIIDKLIKIENLEKELNLIKDRFDIKIKNPKNKVNVSKSNHYQSYYNDKIKKQVEEIFYDDIILSGYIF